METQRNSFRQVLKLNLQQRVTHLALYGGREIEPYHPVEIIPKLYLGDLYSAANAMSLREKGITHILNMSNFKEDAEFFAEGWPEWSCPENAYWVDCESESAVSSPPCTVVSLDYRDTPVISDSPFTPFSKHSRESSMTVCPNSPPVYFTLPIADSNSYPISTHFDETNKFIFDALESQGSVLVHCHAGKSRSVSIILAYLVSVREMFLDDAYNLVARVRPTIKPNPGFARELVALHDDFHKTGRIIGLRGCEDFESRFVVVAAAPIPRTFENNIRKEDIHDIKIPVKQLVKDVRAKISQQKLHHLHPEDVEEGVNSECGYCKWKKLKQQFLFVKKQKVDRHFPRKTKHESLFLSGVELEERLRFQGLV